MKKKNNLTRFLFFFRQNRFFLLSYTQWQQRPDTIRLGGDRGVRQIKQKIGYVIILNNNIYIYNIHTLYIIYIYIYIRYDNIKNLKIIIPNNKKEEKEKKRHREIERERKREIGEG